METTPINEDDALRLLKADSADDPTNGAGDLRRSPRHPYYRIIGLLVAIRQGPAPSYYRVGSRNVSREGMAFIHDRPLPEDTHCAAYLITTEGRYVKVPGCVVRCDGLSEGGFEVGMEFSDPLPMERFVFEDGPPAGPGA